MADQKKWFKVWTSITSDDDFDPSRQGGLIGLGRFAILGAYTALHGEKGKVDILPATLFRLLQVQNIDELSCELALKNVSFEEGKNRYGKIVVTWKNWQKYQEDSTAKDRMKTLRAKRRGEEKRREENINPPVVPQGTVEEKVFLSAKKRKLTGKVLDEFEQFLTAFAYRSGKAAAADSWLQIAWPKDEEERQSLVHHIIEGAKREALRRPDILRTGNTPKMAQGWLTGRRWEDENRPYANGHTDVISILQRIGAEDEDENKDKEERHSQMFSLTDRRLS